MTINSDRDLRCIKYVTVDELVLIKLFLQSNLIKSRIYLKKRQNFFKTTYVGHDNLPFLKWQQKFSQFLQKTAASTELSISIPSFISHIICNKIEIQAFDFTQNGNLMSQLAML